MSYNPIYQREYYQLHRQRILAYNKGRSRAKYKYNNEDAPANYDFPWLAIDRRIKRILGHNPQWWEREYFLEEWEQ